MLVDQIHCSISSRSLIARAKYRSRMTRIDRRLMDEQISQMDHKVLKCRLRKYSAPVFVFDYCGGNADHGLQGWIAE